MHVGMTKFCGQAVHLCPVSNSAKKFTIVRCSSKCYDFSFQSSDFCDFSHPQLTFFLSLLRFFSVVCLANCLMTSDVSLLAVFYKIYKRVAALTNFSRCVTNFFHFS